MHNHRLWIIALAPGMIIAGLVAGAGQAAFGLGILYGTAVTVASQGLLSVCVSGITSPGSWKRQVALAGLHVAKYLFIGVAIYVAVHHPAIDAIGVFVGITLAVAGFVAGQVVTTPTPGISERHGE